MYYVLCSMHLHTYNLQTTVSCSSEEPYTQKTSLALIKAFLFVGSLDFAKPY